jgi:predicted helicase
MIMHWRDYEKEIFQYFKTLYPDCKISYDVKKKGKYSKQNRQIDVLVEATVADFPIILIVDAKYYSKKVDVKEVESFISMLEDLDAHQGLMVTALGYSDAAINRAYY